MTDPSPEPAANDDDQNNPVAILFHLIVTLLTPLFLTGTGANLDIPRARLAAIAALDGYKALTIPELISVAQIIGFGMSALGSLAVSMMDDLSTAILLQLRVNATALSRSEASHQKTLDRLRHHTAQALEKRRVAIQEKARQPRRAHQAQAEAQTNSLTPEAIAANVAAAQKLAAQAQAGMRAAPPPLPQMPQPRQPRPPSLAAIAANPDASVHLPSRPMTPAEDQQRKIAWGTAMATVAAEFAAAPATSPEERRLNELRAAALSSVACQLLGDAAMPQAEAKIAPTAKPPAKS